MTALVTDFWTSILPAQPLERQAHVQRLMVEAELRRAAATYNTGSIDETESMLLWSLAEFLRAAAVIEVGTFIGTSTMALSSAPTVEAIYTCDVSNDCLRSGGAIHAYPKQTSTQMLRDLLARGVTADLCFFDGALSDTDVDLLARLTTPTTVYTVHDYNYGPKIRRKRGVVTHEIMPRKGIGNMNLLRAGLPQHAFIPPMDGTTIAALLPECLL